MALMSERTWDEWIAAYSASHRNRTNQRCHAIGIPMIAVSLVMAMLSVAVHPLFYVAAALFIVGWIFQFVGHAFERKPPEFLRDWRFLFVGLRWWFTKIWRT